MTLVLRGVEVTLRPLLVDDVEALAAALAESREHYGFSEIHEGLEETRRYAEKALGQQAAEQRIPFTIVWCGRVVGTTSYYDFQPWEWPSAVIFNAWIGLTPLKSDTPGLLPLRNGPAVIRNPNIFFFPMPSTSGRFIASA